jgi:eukaryotic-like serine/threonine-protein kinase
VPALALQDPFGLVGTTLDGHYRCESVVGEGGFGVVYRGRHLSLDQPVAIKVLKGLDAEDQRINEIVFGKFRDEARLLYTLSQSSLHIVRSLDFGAVNAPSGAWAPYMVLEWLDGRSLAEDLEERRQRGMRGRSLDEALAILGPAAEALNVAHQRHVAHRDIKPANIFLSAATGLRPQHQPGNVKLLDFGIAKIMKEGEEAGTRGTFASFTWLYAAPEQLDPRVGSTGLATDVYAFALVLTELLTDRQPVDERDVISLLKAATDPTRRPTPRTRGATVPDDIEVACRRALAVDPKSRFATVYEFWGALSAARSRPSVDAMAATAFGGSTQRSPTGVVPSAPYGPPSPPYPSAPPYPSGPQVASAPPAPSGPPRYSAPPGYAGAHGYPSSPAMRHTPPPLSSPPLGTRPPGAGMPVAMPIAPYTGGPPPGTFPPGHPQRPMQAPSSGSNVLVIVTIILFVIMLAFTAMCTVIGSAAS